MDLVIAQSARVHPQITLCVARGLVVPAGKIFEPPYVSCNFTSNSKTLTTLGLTLNISCSLKKRRSNLLISLICKSLGYPFLGQTCLCHMLGRDKNAQNGYNELLCHQIKRKQRISYLSTLQVVVKTLIVLSMIRVPSTICLQDIKKSYDAKNYVLCHAVKKNQGDPVIVL